jgi:hypothetical protein
MDHVLAGVVSAGIAVSLEHAVAVVQYVVGMF